MANLQNFKFRFLFILLLRFYLVAQEGSCESDLIRWVPSKLAEKDDLDTTGNTRINYYSYVIRAKHLGQYIPGKCHSFKIGYYVFRKKEFSATDFEVLVYPRGALRWMTTTSEDMRHFSKDSLTLGGIDPDTYERIYVCRATFWSNTYKSIIIEPGAYNPQDGNCTIPFYGIKTFNRFDVLVKNNSEPATTEAMLIEKESIAQPQIEATTSSTKSTMTSFSDKINLTSPMIPRKNAILTKNENLTLSNNNIISTLQNRSNITSRKENVDQLETESEVLHHDEIDTLLKDRFQQDQNASWFRSRSIVFVLAIIAFILFASLCVRLYLRRRGSDSQLSRPSTFKYFKFSSRGADSDMLI